MAKSITLDSVELAMLDELARKSRLKPDQYLKKIIKEHYDRFKR